VAVLAALAALIALVYAGSAWLHDLREHAGAGHGPGGGAVALAAAALAAIVAAILGLRRIGGSG
jgi:hypothetical protein